jgi:hypothetical protein
MILEESIVSWGTELSWGRSSLLESVSARESRSTFGFRSDLADAK